MPVSDDEWAEDGTQLGRRLKWVLRQIAVAEERAAGLERQRVRTLVLAMLADEELDRQFSHVVGGWRPCLMEVLRRLEGLA